MDDKELRKALRQADTQSDYPILNETVVARGPLSQPKRSINFKAARWSLAGVAASAVAISLALPQAMGPQPLFEMAGSGSTLANSSLAEEAASSADSTISADTAMIWPGWVEYNYIAGDLSNQPGTGEIFEVRQAGDPEALLASLAEIFDVTGTPVRDDWASDDYPSYSMSGDDFSLSTWWYGAAGWSFNRWSNDWAECVEPSMPAEPESMDDEPSDELEIDRATSSGCTVERPTPTPKLVPSEAEMVSHARELFDELGIQLDYSLARTWRDDWGGSVSVPMVVNGQAVPLEAYVGWDSAGNLSYASGFSVEIVSRGTFDTISPTAAVARIPDWRWSGGAPSYLYEELYQDFGGTRAESSTDSAESAPALEPIEDTSGDSDDEPVTKPVPDEQVDPVPSEPEIVDVHVDRSETALLSLYDAQGNMWLVPGYLLYNDEGWFHAIVSVGEGVIALPEPADEIMPMIEEPAIAPEVEPVD